ncbi:major facilitator superfamily transporter [Durotheca rogersii]|uniref:major facilitator superfamily transporter n=1 Tax=Durotheca rogersii TaxID=419775 RepID=UPI00221F00A8|nr:major facilitator superfamily transporter [Durotheca rogersii]KAI5866407.1 major facilitator superfamily transporter [Durotheca rogersii]
MSQDLSMSRSGDEKRQGTPNDVIRGEEEGREKEESKSSLENGDIDTVPPPDNTGAATAEPPSEQPEADGQPPIYSVFTSREKAGIVLGVAVAAFFSPLTAMIYLPAINALADEFHVSVSDINLTITTYMIFQGLTPMLVGSFADSAGRRPAYGVCAAVYVGANVGCALAPSYGALLALRMVQSAGSSATVALCQAVVADVATAAERGAYVGFTTLPILLAPALGPVLGGILAQHAGWRAIFWLLAAAAAALALVLAAVLPETCREIVADGSRRPPPAYRTLWQVARDARARRRAARRDNALPPALTPADAPAPTARPARRKFDALKSLTILLEREIFLLLAFGSVVLAGFYCVVTALPPQLAAGYGYDDTTVGLLYLPMAGGSAAAALLNGRLMNWNYRRHCRLRGVAYDRRRQQDLAGLPIERARLEVGAPLLGAAAAALPAWGWALERRAHPAALCALLFLLGWALVGFNNTANALLVDVNPGSAGAATASGNLARCLVGAAATAAIGPLIAAVGVGWAFTLLAALYVAASPMLFLVLRNGVRWREEKRRRELAREERRGGSGCGGGTG